MILTVSATMRHGEAGARTGIREESHRAADGLEGAANVSMAWLSTRHMGASPVLSGKNPGNL
jgi:hypothetical protein